MSDRLRLVFEEASKLPEFEQEALAAIIEEELADEKGWQQRFSQTPSTLAGIEARAKKQFADAL